MTEDDLDQLRALVHRDIEQRKELEQTVVQLSDRVAKLKQRIETFERYLDEGNG